ncbi:MAG: hypothetical protein JSR39_00145 [Verrucomicrobia bacterium]|nr:hypothetical protein [Verrucomicrobiota bacterium]
MTSSSGAIPYSFDALRLLPTPDFSFLSTPVSDDPVPDGKDVGQVIPGFGSTVEMNHDYFTADLPPLDGQHDPFLFEATSAARTNSVFSSKVPQLQSSTQKSAQETPEKVKTLKRVISEYDFEVDGEPYGTPKKQIIAGIRALQEELSDTPVKKQKSTQSRVVHRLFADEVVGRDPEAEPVEFHAKAFEMTESSPTLKRLFGAVVHADRTAQHKALSLPIPKEIINIKHLIEADKRGFHLCLFNDPMFTQLSNFQYSNNSVYQANFPVDQSGKLKSSTFFPLHGVDELVQVIHSAQPIATIGNRFLCFVPDQPYLVEMYKSGAVIKSAFPIFYFTKWDADLHGHPIVRGKPLVSSNDLLEKARHALLEYSKPSMNPNPWNPIRYTIESDELWSDLIIDLAPSFPELGISQGIFVQFPRSLFEDLIDPEVLDEMSNEV